MSQPELPGAAAFVPAIPTSGQSTESVDGRLRARALADPARPAIVDDAGALTYGELNVVVDRMAASLQRRGVMPLVLF